jgi:hypothetical protein
VNAIQGYLEKLGGNFMIAAFVPSLAFVTACMIAFSPLVPPAFVERVRIALSPLDDNGLIILLVAIVMGFTLTSLNTYVYKLFEGYVLLNIFRPLQQLEITRARKIRNGRDRLNKKIEHLEKWQQDWVTAKMPIYHEERLNRLNERIKLLKNKRDSLATEYDLKYPPLDSMILPTRLGNILRAAEVYSQDRYHADSVVLWPRMVWAIDKEYMGHVDAANDQCSFLLNSALLSGVFAIMALSISCYQLLTPEYSSETLRDPISYGLASLFAWGVAWFFYNASLLNVTKYGNLIRSSYDLFRFNLLEKLHLKLPRDNQREKELWYKLSEFITIGELYGEQYFDYDHEDKVGEAEEETSLRSLLSSAGISDDA